jgi:hypothetical protein
VSRWTLPRGAPAVVSAGTGLGQVTVAPDGRRLIATGGGGRVLEVDLLDGQVVRRTFGERVVKAAAFAGERLLVTGMDGPQMGWASTDGWVPLVGARPLRRVATLASGAVVGIDMDDGLFAWADPTGAPARALRGRRLVDLAVWDDGVVVLDTAGAVARWADGAVREIRGEEGARALDAAAGCLALARRDAVTVRCADGERVLSAEDDVLLDVALSPDAARVAAGTLGGRVRVWDRETGRLLGLLPGHDERVAAVVFLPDGDLASASWVHSVRIWDLDALGRPLPAIAADVEAAAGAPSR